MLATPEEGMGRFDPPLRCRDGTIRAETQISGRMTYAPVPPAVLEKAIDRMAAELGISRDAVLESLTPVVIEWCITRTAADLEITSREARRRIARAIDRTA